MKKLIIGIVCFLFFATSVHAEVIYLKDGSVIKGTITRSSEEATTVKTSMGEMVIKKADIERVSYGEAEKPEEKPVSAPEPVKEPVKEIYQLKPLIKAETPLIGSLLVDSFPSKGKVYLNNEYVGATPLRTKDILVGVYALKIISRDLGPFRDYIEVPLWPQEKVFVKLGTINSRRIENPGYAYETKLGIQVNGVEEHSFLSVGPVFYSPHFRADADIGLGSLFMGSFSGKAKILMNIPLDWWSFQLGASYSWSIKSYYDSSYAINIIGFPIGCEFFLDPHWSFDFHLGPAYWTISSSYGSYSYTYGDPAVVVGGGINFYL